MAQSSPWFVARYPVLHAHLEAGGTIAELIPKVRARRAEREERVPQPRFTDEESVLEAYMGRGMKLERRSKS